MSERGSLTFWGLGLAIMILMLGLLMIDLWRILADRRELAAITDAAAIAAASAVDERAWREHGIVRLQPGLAELKAQESLESQIGAADVVVFEVDVAEDGTSVGVTAARLVEFGVLGLLSLNAEPELMTVTATAEPRSGP